MGDDEMSTVYAAELRTMEMAVALVLESTRPWIAQAQNGLVIFADNQAAVKALRRPNIPSIHTLTLQSAPKEIEWYIPRTHRRDMEVGGAQHCGANAAHASRPQAS